MRKKYLDVAKERKLELLNLIKTSKDKDIKNNAVFQTIQLSEKYNLRKTKEEKEMYCKFCKTAYNSNTKIRIKTIKKNKLKKLQKILICGNCGKEQKISI